MSSGSPGAWVQGSDLEPADGQGVLRRIRQITPGQVAVGIITLIVGSAVIVPLGAVVLMSLRKGLPGRTGALTLVNYQTVFFDPSTYEVLLNTCYFAFWTILITLLFAAPIVWLLNRTDIPFKKATYLLMIAGTLIPVFLRAIGWVILLSPEIGLVNKLAMTIFGLREPPLSVYNIVGMAFVQGISFVPTAFFMLSASYHAMDPALEEAAYSSGVSKFRTFLKINVPITTPAIAAVMVYLLMTALSVFEAPAILGMPSGIYVFSSLIYFAVNPQVGLPNYGLAGAYGFIMMVLGVLTSYLYFRVVREGRRYVVVTGRGYRPRLIELRRLKPLAVAFVFLYFSLEIFMPFLVLLWCSLLPYLQMPSTEALSRISLRNYGDILQHATLRPFINTAVLVTVAPTLSVALSVAISWIVVRTRSRVRGLLDNLAFLPHATPNILFAVALSYLALVYRTALPIYGTITIIIIAHAISHISYGTRAMNSAMIQIHAELEEAGRACGASTLRVLGRIVIPLVGTALLNAWLWIALLSYREVTMALVLYGPGSEVISTLIWKLWGSAWVPLVSAVGVVMILLVLLLVFAFQLLLSWLKVGEALQPQGPGAA